MIDLEKEREAIKQEIRNLHESVEFITEDDKDSFDSIVSKVLALGRAERQSEIDSLKAQLAKYESGEFVVVPRNSKTVVAIEKMVEQQVETSGITQDVFRLDGYRILDAMVEAAGGGE